MNPSFLSSNYRQYKKDTEYIAGWLVQHSQKAGYSLSNNTRPGEALPSPQRSEAKAKAKARTRPRRAAPTTPNGSVKPKSIEYRVAVVDYVPMAQAIAEHVPKIQVPLALKSVFDRAIDARRRAMRFFLGSHDEQVNESTSRHAHFVSILETAFGTLEPLIKKQVPQNYTETKLRRRMDSVLAQDVNPFSELTVQECAKSDALDGDDDSNTIELLATLPPVAHVEVQQDDTETEAEFFFAIQSFINNLHELRDIVQETWFNYKDGKIDSIQASLMANTAIDLVRHAEAELDLLLIRPKKYPAKKFPIWTLPGLLFSHCHPWTTIENTMEEFVLPSGLMIPNNHSDCWQVHWCFWPVYVALKFYLYETMQASKPKTANPDIQPSTFDPVGGAHDDTLRTVTWTREFRHWILCHNDQIAIDEVTRGMIHMFKHNEVPIWTTFGMQILLDIEDILTPDHIGDPYRELQLHVKRKTSPSSVADHKTPFQRFRQEDGKIQKVHNHNLDILKRRVELDPCDHIKTNPIRCGLMKYDLYLLHLETYMQHESMTGEICMIAHLYIAIRLLYPDASRWPDMELVLHQQDVNRLFFGGVPTTLDECSRKIQLTLGRATRNPAHQSGKLYRRKIQEDRWIREASAFAPIFKKRSFGWATTNESVDTLVTRLSNTLRSPTDQARLARQLNKPMSTIQTDLGKHRQRSYIEQHIGNENGPTALLRDLQIWLEGDAVDLYFDWKSMRMVCGHVWQSIIHELEKLDGWDTKRGDGPVLAANILYLAARDETAHGRIARDDPTFAVPLRKVAHVVQATIHKSNADVSNTYGETMGQICLTTLCTQVKHMSQILTNGGTACIDCLYGNWTQEAREQSPAYMLVDQATSIQNTKASHSRGENSNSSRSNDFDPCAHCPRCKRRRFLGKRYPGYLGHEKP